MALKTLLVHLDPGERSAARLALAVELARLHQARLIGLFAKHSRAHTVGIVSVWPNERYRVAAEASQTAFAAATAGLPNAQWRDANRGGDEEVISAVTEASRSADLVILGQDGGEGAEVPHALVERVILNSGRPVLVIPYIGDYASVGKRPMIAWNHSPAAARALHDALPLIAGATAARVVSFAANPNEDRDFGADCIAHLADHGVTARYDLMITEEIGVMDLLLNRAADEGTDLLVMGAHMPGGIIGFKTGGGTRHILAHMTVPVLMSH